MFHTGPAWLPREIEHHKNLMPRSEECAKLAYRAKAEAEFFRLNAKKLPEKDTISLKDGLLRDAEEHDKIAEQMYAQALRLQDEYRENRTTWEKTMPILMNTTIGVVVLAEVISLPLLVINICQMSKHKKQQPQLPS